MYRTNREEEGRSSKVGVTDCPNLGNYVRTIRIFFGLGPPPPNCQTLAALHYYVRSYKARWTGAACVLCCHIVIVKII